MTTPLLFALILINCKVLNTPYYIYQNIHKSKNNNYTILKLKRKNIILPPTINGNVKGQIDSLALSVSVIKIGKTILNTDNSGFYSWQGRQGSYTIQARSIGFRDIMSKKIILNRGDSIILNFYLPVGPPITHKMQKNSRN